MEMEPMYELDIPDDKIFNPKNKPKIVCDQCLYAAPPEVQEYVVRQVSPFGTKCDRCGFQNSGSFH